MRYEFGSNGFLDHRRDLQEDVDPMGSLANMADCMLVLACGLMMALVVYWNLDLPSIQEMDPTDMQQVEDVEEITGEITSTTNPYMELGKVYQDPATGKLYMLTETEVEGAGSEGDASADEGSSEGDAAGESNAAGDTSANEGSTDASQGAQE